jgi:hypothetical protein
MKRAKIKQSSNVAVLGIILMYALVKSIREKQQQAKNKQRRVRGEIRKC